MSWKLKESKDDLLLHSPHYASAGIRSRDMVSASLGTGWHFLSFLHVMLYQAMYTLIGSLAAILDKDDNILNWG